MLFMLLLAGCSNTGQPGSNAQNPGTSLPSERPAVESQNDNAQPLPSLTPESIKHNVFKMLAYNHALIDPDNKDIINQYFEGERDATEIEPDPDDPRAMFFSYDGANYHLFTDENNAIAEAMIISNLTDIADSAAMATLYAFAPQDSNLIGAPAKVRRLMQGQEVETLGSVTIIRAVTNIGETMYSVILDHPQDDYYARKKGEIIDSRIEIPYG